MFLVNLSLQGNLAMAESFIGVVVITAIMFLVVAITGYLIFGNGAEE